MIDSIQVKCQKCGTVYWTDLYKNQSGRCCVGNCGGQLMEYMNDNFDYGTKKYLDNKL